LNKEFVFVSDIPDSVRRRSSVDILNDDLKITTVYSVLSAYPWTHCTLNSAYL